MAGAALTAAFPRALADYPDLPGEPLTRVLASRVELEPFNAIATGIFALAILHTFLAARFAALAHRVQHRHDERCRAKGEAQSPSVLAGVLHFLGEVEVVFGLWAAVLMVAITVSIGWHAAVHYLSETVVYDEALFVVVIMALAMTRPVIGFAESSLRWVAAAGGATPAAWWVAILTIGPLLGSFITEPGAMTISALLLGRQFYDLQPSTRLKYATLGMLFVNVSIGGTLTHFAAPPVLMVARPWEWDTTFMLENFGWRAALAILTSTLVYFLLFRRELMALSRRPAVADVEVPDDEAGSAGLLPVPGWVTLAHLLFMAWTILNAHAPALFIGGFLFFIGFSRATAAYQGRLEMRMPLLVGFFLAGLVIHGGLQQWWIGPVLRGLERTPLFLGSTFLTAVNDNALITYLATLVPSLDHSLRLAVVAGAVVGGGLTVIANAPNPAGQAVLSRYFGGAVSPLGLFAGAVVPTLIAAAAFHLL